MGLRPRKLEGKSFGQVKAQQYGHRGDWPRYLAGTEACHALEL